MKTSTVYQKSIKNPIETEFSVLKKGSSNKKLGFKVTAKKWTGKRLYSLTLVERETCPTSCHHWNDCYGNNMPFAHRFDSNGITTTLEEEIAILMDKHKNGIVIRLHVLGDFFSTAYIKFWEDMLIQYPKLCLFGYTARWDDDIYRELNLLNLRYSDRCVIRFSRNYSYDEIEDKIANRYAASESFEGKSFDCPEQTGTIKDCASCGLCWTTNKNVRFASH